jgi:hypothetical protein
VGRGARICGALFALALLTPGCRLDDSVKLDDTEFPDLEGDSGGTARCVIVVTTEFTTSGSIAVVDADTLEVTPDITAVHQDAYVRVDGDRVFVVNRQGGDNIQELDPSRGYATIWQYSVGNRGNPWDLTLLEDGTAWVPLYNEGALLHVDTLADSGESFRIDSPVPLPTWTDDDLRVEPFATFLYDDVLYVLVQGLDDYPRCSADSRGYLHARAPSTLALREVFDGSSTLELARCNPTSYALLDDGRLVVGHSGALRTQSDALDDGGIEIVDLRAGVSLGLVATEEDFGDRDLVRVAFGEEDRVWVALADEDFAVAVYSARLDDTGFTLGQEVWRSDTGGIFDLAERYGRVWIADRTTGASGLMVLDAETGDPVVDEPLGTGFPPFDFDFIERPSGRCL